MDLVRHYVVDFRRQAVGATFKFFVFYMICLMLFCFGDIFSFLSVHLQEVVMVLPLKKAASRV